MKFKNLRINSFNPLWWFYILLQLASIIVIKLTVVKVKLFLTLFALFTILFLLVYKYILVTTSNGQYIFANELPLYLCNLNIIYGLIGVIYENQILLGFCYSIGLVGAILALVMPEEDFTNIPFFSSRAFGFYGYHSLLLIFDISLVTTNFFKPQYNIVLKIMLLAVITLLAVHLINIII